MALQRAHFLTSEFETKYLLIFIQKISYLNRYFIT